MFVVFFFRFFFFYEKRKEAALTAAEWKHNLARLGRHSGGGSTDGHQGAFSEAF